MKIRTLSLLLTLWLCSCLWSETYIPRGEVSGHWNTLNSPYYIEGNITIPEDESLQVDGGVEIIFLGNYRFKIKGEILALGSVSEPITFSPGNMEDTWRGFEFLSESQNSSTLEHIIVNNAKKGIKISYSSPSIINSSFQFSDENRTGNSVKAVDIDGDSSPVIDNCIFEGYCKGIFISNNELDEETNPVITNTRLRDGAETERGNSKGIKISGLVQVNIQDCEIDNYKLGIILENNSDNVILNSSIINTRVRNDTEYERGGTKGIQIYGLIASTIENCEISSYDKGIKIENNDRNQVIESTLTNTRVRNSEETERSSSLGIDVSGYVSLSVSDCDIEFYEKGLSFNTDFFIDSSVSVLTNTRVRNNPEVERTNNLGILVENYKYFELNDCNINGYNSGLKYINEDGCYTAEPALFNSLIINSTESDRGSKGMTFEGKISAQIESCEIYGYDKAIQFEYSGDDLIFPLIKNTTTSLNLADDRSSTYGLFVEGAISFTIDNLDIWYYEIGIYGKNENLQALSSPVIMNSRIRNSSETERGNTYGIKLEKNIEPVIDNCEIEDYDFGIMIENLDREGEITSATISNSRVRNNPETSRNVSEGIITRGFVEVTIDNCDLEYLSKALVIENNTGCNQKTEPMVTNTRVRNSLETERECQLGFFLEANINGYFYNNRFINCNPAVKILGTETNALFSYNLIYQESENTGWIAITAEDSDSLCFRNNTICFYDYGLISETAIVRINSSIIWKYDAVQEPINLSPNIQVSYSNVSRPDGQIYPGLENINQDPFFEGGNRDFCFELSPESPCIDAGDPELPPDPDNTVVDIGMFPYLQGRYQKIKVEPVPGTRLFKNFPNPFNPTTTILFSLNEGSRVIISIYNSQGQLVKILTDKLYEPGIHSLQWNALDNKNHAVASGIYFIRMMSNGYDEIRKITLIK